jgi:hypothetical protein
MNDLATIQRINNAIESAKQRKLAKATNARKKTVKATAEARAAAEKTRTGKA